MARIKTSDKEALYVAVNLRPKVHANFKVICAYKDIKQIDAINQIVEAWIDKEATKLRIRIGRKRK